jgi:hypothetical protein
VFGELQKTSESRIRMVGELQKTSESRIRMVGELQKTLRGVLGVMRLVPKTEDR